MKILLSDLDGTLLTNKKEIRPRVQEAIDLWKAQGNHFIVATGRLISSAQYFADMTGSGDLVVACSGATIYKRGEMVYEKTVPTDIVERLWDLLKDSGEYAQVYSDRSLVYNSEKGLLGGYKLHNNYGEKYKLPLILMEDYDRKKIPGSVHKLSFVCHDSKRAQDIIDSLGDLSEVNLFRSLPHLYDIISKDADKGLAGSWLQDLLKAESLYAIGDNENDIAMLEEADLSAVVLGSPKHVSRKADLVVSSNEEDGVAEFIHYLLNNNL